MMEGKTVVNSIKLDYKALRKIYDVIKQHEEDVKIQQAIIKSLKEQAQDIVDTTKVLISKTEDKKFADSETGITMSIVKSTKTKVNEDKLLKEYPATHKRFVKVVEKFQIAEFKKAAKEEDYLNTLGVIETVTKETLQVRDNKLKGEKK